MYQILPCASGKYFYPRPPRGGRQFAGMLIDKMLIFLSTPSARRATAFLPLPVPQTEYFYPRPPRGGRRNVVVRVKIIVAISIHALREEGDREQAQV